MKRTTIFTVLIATVFVLTGCSTDNASEVQQEQTEAAEKIDTEIVTEATEVIEEEIPLELTAQNPNIELNVGDQNKLLYTANRDADLTYSSSDETIATVDENGIVTAVGGGTATITAMSEGVSCEWIVESNLEWEKIYADYFTTNSEFREKFCGEFDDSVCGEVYINNDNIPEMVVNEQANFRWTIYSIINQKVECVWDDSPENLFWGGASYRVFDCIEKTGLFFLRAYPMGIHSEYIDFYNLDDDNNLSIELSRGLDDIYFAENGEDKATYYKNKENEISEEEFNKQLDELSNGEWNGLDKFYYENEISIPINDFIATYQ